MAAGESSKSFRHDNSPGSEDAENIVNFDNSRMIINKMATLYAEKIMSDIVLVVGNNMEYPAHKLILCASSDVFQIMLHDSKWSESNEKRVTLGETPSCAAVFEDFLKYLYTGKIHLNYCTVVPIVSLADKYNVKDLLKLGLDYMERNVSLACKKNQVVSWFQLTLASGHTHVANLCANFIKSNFEMVSKTIDFPSMEPELLTTLIRSNDLVIYDEFKLFDCISRWLTSRKAIMENSGEENIDLHFDRYVNVLMSHVRFPMMSHHQLVELLLHPVSKSHTNMIVEKIREGLRFHKGEEEIGPTIDNRIYTPRLYTTEKFCASLSVDHFYELPSYHCRSLLFSSQRYNAEYQGDGQLDWSVDLYPKGVWFQRCLTVYRPSGKEVPEKIVKTVRVSVKTKLSCNETCHEQCHLNYLAQSCLNEIRVKIGILIVGNQDNFEHVRCVRSRNFIFSHESEIVNFDEIVDFEELLTLKPKSQYLSGENRESFKIIVSITPMSKYSSLSVT